MKIKPKTRVSSISYTPASELQIAQRQTNWFNKFLLHRISVFKLPQIGVSERTMKALHQYNRSVSHLRNCIQDDYREFKKDVLARRKAITALNESKKDIDTL